MSKGLLAVGLIGGLVLGVVASLFLGGFISANDTTDQTALDDSYRSGYANGFEAGKLEGYNQGFVNGSAASVGSGFNIRDPTYAEVISFISGDNTDEQTYNFNSYNCFHFCRDFKTAAFNQGLKAGFVYVEFQDGAHSIVCFNTVDRGLVYVEPQSDSIVSLVVGGDYEFVEEPNTVVSVTVIW
jgi:hypothetical protein